MIHSSLLIHHHRFPLFEVRFFTFIRISFIIFVKSELQKDKFYANYKYFVFGFVCAWGEGEVGVYIFILEGVVVLACVGVCVICCMTSPYFSSPMIFIFFLLSTLVNFHSKQSSL